MPSAARRAACTAGGTGRCRARRRTRVQALDQGLGGEGAPAGRAGLDPRRLVDLVAERRHLGAAGGHQAPDVERGSPVHPEADADRLRIEVAAPRGLGGRGPDVARGGDARTRGARLVAAVAGEEERGHAVADVLADDAARTDDTLVDAEREPAQQREVRGGRKPAGEGRRALQIGEEDRRGPAGRGGRSRASGGRGRRRRGRACPSTAPGTAGLPTTAVPRTRPSSSRMRHTMASKSIVPVP